MNIGYKNLFCWFDLHTPDKNLSRFFYESLLAWTFEDHKVGEEAAYTGLSSGGRGFGSVEPLPREDSAQWIGYVGVEAFAASHESIMKLGGTCILEGVNIEALGTIGIYGDPCGGVFAILEPMEKNNLAWLPKRGGAGDLDWAELNIANASSALDFYAGVFGWEFSSETPEALGDYHFIMRQGAPVGGIRKVEPDAQAQGWSFYANVSDFEASLKSASGLRGEVLIEREVEGVVRFALMSDPQGARIGIARGV